MARYTLEHGLHRNRRWPFYLVIVTLLLAVVFYPHIGSIRVGKRSPAIAKAAEQSTPTDSPAPQLRISAPLPWPSYGQSAYGVIDDGVLAKSNDKAEPVPIASLAKTITALAVLKQKPLALGEQGPAITLTEEDEASYREYIAKSGTVVEVKAGVQISEYQALQAMLMPSANNMADTLARWAFGSIENYNIQANNMLKGLGINQTTVADASGYSPLTKSTAADMVKIGLLYIQNPVLRQIAELPKATIPFTGVVYNYNDTHNENGIEGIKIGYTEQAGRTFIAADVKASSPNEISVVAVLGAQSMPTAMQDAERLLKSGNEGHSQLR